MWSEETAIALLSWLMLCSAAATAGALLFTGMTAGYGRYAESGQLSMPARLGWFIQEAPAFAIPFYFLIFHSSNTIGQAILGMMILHYFQRTFVYPVLMATSKPSPVKIVASAVVFCMWNGYIQGAFHAKYASYDAGYDMSMRFYGGVALFLTGWLINLHSDHVLQNLRKPGEMGYKIPRGGFFEYVSCANYFGECIEWTGYALAAQSLPAVAFAVFTWANIGPRALQHHKWYQEKFDNYPRSRKALTPFVI